MRLPLELRLRVYEAALGRRTVHVALESDARECRPSRQTREVLERRWRHSICTWAQAEDDRDRNVWRDQCQTSTVDGAGLGPRNGTKEKLKLDFALLLTCRKV